MPSWQNTRTKLHHRVNRTEQNNKGQHKTLPKTALYPNSKPKIKHILSFQPKNLCYPRYQTMTSILNPTITLIQTKFKNLTRLTSPPDEKAQNTLRRKFLFSTFLGGSGFSLFTVPLNANAKEEEFKWGTRSFLWEHFFEPGLSPEDAVSRIRNTADGLHELRHMLDTMAWRYIIFYIRLKQAYLKQDMQTALAVVPEGLKKDYVNAANELVGNMAEFDYYVRTPKVYESYLFYEKTLKSIDSLVSFLV